MFFKVVSTKAAIPSCAGNHAFRWIAVVLGRSLVDAPILLEIAESQVEVFGVALSSLESICLGELEQICSRTVPLTALASVSNAGMGENVASCILSIEAATIAHVGPRISQ